MEMAFSGITKNPDAAQRPKVRTVVRSSFISRFSPSLRRYEETVGNAMMEIDKAKNPMTHCPKVQSNDEMQKALDALKAVPDGYGLEVEASIKTSALMIFAGVASLAANAIYFFQKAYAGRIAPELEKAATTAILTILAAVAVANIVAAALIYARHRYGRLGKALGSKLKEPSDTFADCEILE